MFVHVIIIKIRARLINITTTAHKKRPNESILVKMTRSHDYDGGTGWKLRAADVFLPLSSGSLKAHTSKSRH